MKYHLLSIVLMTFLVGCGGGGAHKTSSPPVPASSPSSSATVSSVSSSSSSSSDASSMTSTSSSSASSIPFTLTSNSFTSGEVIPVKYTCFGAEISPQLQWEITSTEIQSFALIVEDLDAIAIVGHPYVHWNVYHIPADVRQIAEDASLRTMPLGSVEGVNDDGQPKYAGPCPPPGTGTHHYFFALYALNTAKIAVSTTRPYERSEFETQFANAIIQKVEITGLYTR